MTVARRTKQVIANVHETWLNARVFSVLIQRAESRPQKLGWRRHTGKLPRWLMSGLTREKMIQGAFGSPTVYVDGGDSIQCPFRWSLQRFI